MGKIVDKVLRFLFWVLIPLITSAGAIVQLTLVKMAGKLNGEYLLNFGLTIFICLMFFAEYFIGSGLSLANKKYKESREDLAKAYKEAVKNAIDEKQRWLDYETKRIYDTVERRHAKDVEVLTNRVQELIRGNNEGLLKRGAGSHSPTLMNKFKTDGTLDKEYDLTNPVTVTEEDCNDSIKYLRGYATGDGYTISYQDTGAYVTKSVNLNYSK